MDHRLETFDVSVTVSARPDGGIRVTSADVPGLLLSGSDRARIWSVVGVSVKSLLKANRGLDVTRVSGPMTPPDTDGEVGMHVEHLTIEYRLAA